MSQENQSSLRFSLEESLWFRKGQEVEELVSISLDPDITIQENDQYITIRGSLELTGEYKIFPESNPSEEDTLSAQKYVQTVEVREEGVCEFSHRFPVDITIPNNRIQSIYDIDVVVESFDYTLPESNCLKLSAELMISGLYGYRQDEQPVMEEVVVEEKVEDLELQLEREQEWIDEQADNQEEEQEEKIEALYRSTSIQNDTEIEVEIQNLEEEQYDDYSHLFSAEARKQPEDETIVETNNYPNFPYQLQNDSYNQQVESFLNERHHTNDHVDIKVEKETYETEEYVEEPYISSEESSSSSSSSSSSDAHKKYFKNKVIEKITKKKSMSLTEFFARREDSGEDQVKLKVCIVQKGETLGQLADRYEVTLQKLLQVNQLEINQDVYEGQVLYIPKAMSKR